MVLYGTQVKYLGYRNTSYFYENGKHLNECCIYSEILVTVYQTMQQFCIFNVLPIEPCSYGIS